MHSEVQYCVQEAAVYPGCLSDVPPPLALLSEVLAGSSQAVLDSLARIKEVFSYLTLLPPAPAVSLLQALLVGGWVGHSVNARFICVSLSDIYFHPLLHSVYTTYTVLTFVYSSTLDSLCSSSSVLSDSDSVCVCVCV